NSSRNIGLNESSESIAQTGLPGLLLFAIPNRNFRRGRHSGDSRYVLGSGSPLILVRTTEHDGLKRQAAPQIKKTNAFRSVKFVPGETGSIYRRDIEAEFPERL